MPRDEQDVGTESGSGSGADPAPDGVSTPSEGVPDRPPGNAIAEALSVRRNALAGVAAGLTLAVAVYVVRVFELLGPNVETRQYPVLGPEGYFLLLGFVLASATALLVATALTVVSAVRLARREV